MKILKLSFIITFFAFNLIVAQTGVVTNYQFDKDSLNGFSESETIALASSRGYNYEECQYFFYRSKRAFLKEKYHLKRLVLLKENTQEPLGGDKTFSLSVPCDNEDFELALSQPYDSINIQGWNVSSGLNYGGCSLPAYGSAGSFTVFTSPVLDPVLNYTVGSYFDSNSSNIPSGSCFVKLNDEIAGSLATALYKTFMINSVDTLFQYAFFSVLEGGGHNCCDQAKASIIITITDTITHLSTVLAAPNISLVPNDFACQTTSLSVGLLALNNTPGWFYSPWNAYAINLKPYLNKQFRIDVTAMDCNAGGHAGYMYFDAKCGNNLNSIDSLFHLKDTVRLISCTYPATLSIPSASCHITGPTFNYTPPLFRAFLSGTYSFEIYPGASLPSYTRTLILDIDFPHMDILPYTNKICLGESIELRTTGVSGFRWSTGDTTASIIVSPTVLTTYTASSRDSSNCESSNYRAMDVYVCTGIEELQKEEASLIYPNPNEGEFYLNLESEKSELSLRNNAGQTVFKQFVYTGKNKIKVTLVPGIYYYFIKEANSFLKGKLSIE